MSVYAVVLFLHLAGSAALFLGYGIEWAASSLFRNASSVTQLRSWLRVFMVSPPVAGAGLGVLLLSGGYLASLSGAMKQGWIPASLVAIFIALVLGFAMILPRMRAIRNAIPQSGDEISSELRAKISDPVLLTAIRVRVLVATGIVYLMAARLAFLPSLLAILVAIVVGVILSISAWKSKPQ
jgi:hypothetical protein